MAEFKPHPKPRAEGETDEAYAKRTANFAKSRERLNSVGIKGRVNEATTAQLDAFKKQYGHGPAGYNPKPTQGPGSTPQTTPPKPPAPPKPDNPGKPQQGPSSAGASASGGSRQNRPSGFGSNSAGSGSPMAQGASAGMSQMPGGRRGRRRARQAMRRTM